jgi:Protein of unknown function (DUF3662)/FHA domain
MRALDQLESFLQGLIERPTGLLTPKGLQPVQLAAALTKALEDRALRLVDRIVVPNRYVLSVSPHDFARLQAIHATLEQELTEYVERLAAERELSLPDDPSVQIRLDRGVPPGRTQVEASFPPNAPPTRGAREQPRRATAPRQARAVPTRGLLAKPGSALTLLRGDGTGLRQFRLAGPWMTLGRRSSNDIPLPDLKVSRRHLRFELSGGAWYLTDLDSTNGTRINGQDVTGRNRLRSGDIIEVGLQRLRFGPQTVSKGDRP